MVIRNYDTTWPGEDGEPPEGDEQKKIRSGCLTRAFSGTAWGFRSTSERGTKSEVAHLWAKWLLNPCRLGEPLRIRAGD